MKTTIKIQKVVDLKTLQVKAGVRYWEDSEVNGEQDAESGEKIPCKVGGLWMPEIDIDTGKISNWPKGVTASINYKVCDCCGWEVKDEKGDVIWSADDGYVPDTLCPKESGHGDYIIMDIDANGIIADWNFDSDDFNLDD